MSAIATRRIALGALAAVIIGALTPSYLHLVDWWKPMMPDGWQALAMVAALVTEATIVACGWIGATMGASLSEDGRRVVTRLEAAGVVAAVYVNARWAALRPGAAPLTPDVAGMFTGLDMIVGAAMLPVVAWAAFRAIDHVVAAGRVVALAEPAQVSTANVVAVVSSAVEVAAAAAEVAAVAMSVAGAVEAASTVGNAPAPVRRPRPLSATGGGVMARDASVASAWNVSPRTARDWRTKGDPRYNTEARAA